ncbi:helix-turn-helix transcriptional regulator [Streptomyces cylindrosporus]|uniref:HTH luxR-type domain-containing protein n=1 Tax=Streptomyces cylindrosporus TaxID=2927583 RepID=A0ABS9YK01_9ACTN|nr:hypothetical protein [Streptomyces cylindrosporus]MCI3277581.1 hypothetical protein [Streptomyces cylindrosporus]
MTSTTEANPGAPLSPAQVRVIAAYACGGSTATLTADLGMSERTIRRHVQRAARRATISNRVLPGLVDYAYRHGYFADIPDLAIKPRTPPPHLRLPISQLRTLQYMAQGLSTGATARKLGIKRESARAYRDRLYERLGTTCAYRAVALGWQWGLLGPANSGTAMSR